MPAHTIARPIKNNHQSLKIFILVGVHYTMSSRFNYLLTAILLSSLTTACGGGGGGGSSSPPPMDPPDDPPAPMDMAPTVNVLFPNQSGLTNNNFITIRGTASDDSGNVTVTVNGEEAETDDNFATWEAFIDLELGENSYTVVATDDAGNTSMAMGSVNRATLFGAPSSLVMDTANNRALISDELLQSIFAVDLTSGERSVLFDNSGLALDLFVNPTDVYLDEANNRLLVLDFVDPPTINGAVRQTVFDLSPKRLWAVDLETGERTVLIDTINFLLQHPLYDSANNQLIGSFAFSDIGTIDIDSGMITTVNSFRDPMTNNPIASITAIDLDAVNNQLIVADLAFERILSTPFGAFFGTITEISTNTTPNNQPPLFIDPSLINLDASRGRILVRNFFTNQDQLISIDSSTGERSVFISSNVPTGQNPIGSINDLIINGDEALMIDFLRDSLINVDLDSGNRTTISDIRFPTQDSENNMFRAFTDLILDEENNRALVSDRRNNTILAIDLDTGIRTNFATLSSATGIPAEIERASNGDLFVLDADLNRIVMIAADTTDETILATDPSFAQIASFTLDEANSRIILFDRGSNSVGIIDLVNNTASVVAENVLTIFPPNPNSTILGVDIAYDAANSRALLVDSSNSVVFAVNLDSGETTDLSNNDLEDQPNMLSFPASLKLDPDNNRVLLSDLANRDVTAIDLNTGERTVLFRSKPEENVIEADDLLLPLSLAIDSNGNIVILNIFSEDSLDLIDVTLDEKVIISR